MKLTELLPEKDDVGYGSHGVERIQNTGWRRSFYLLLLCFVISSLGSATSVIFNPGSVSGGPFPSNKLTTPDATTRTGLRIALAKADAENCLPGSHIAVCSNAALLNQLDGFSVNPRMMVCFSGSIDPKTIKSGIIVVPVDNPKTMVTLNQIIYDSSSACAYAKPESVLKQRSQYLLLITDAVKDANSQPLVGESLFKACLASSDSYCSSLSRALTNVSLKGNAVVSASLFSTLSATSWLEDARTYVNSIPGIALPAGFPYVFRLAEIKSAVWKPDQASFSSQALPLASLSNVDQVAFGLFLSPNYLNVSGPAIGSITTGPTTPVPLPGTLGGLGQGLVPVSFHVFVPKGTAPEDGWPVAVYGHGLGDNQFGAPTYIASTLASQGIATVAMEIMGHGFGPQGSVEVTSNWGWTTTELTPGRGVASAPGATIGAEDGCLVLGAIAIRDCGRQTAVDLFSLVKTIRQTQGLGLGLDPSRITYVGQSFGSIYGSLFHALEPTVMNAVLNAGGGTSVDIARLAVTGRPLGIEYLASVNPALLNVIAGIAPPESYFHDPFNDGYVYRDQPPASEDSVPEALQIQAAFEAAEWLGMLGDPLAYAPHFKTLPLAGVPAKSTLFQFGLGDLEVPNPTESALVRAADGLDSTWYFRFDKAVALDPSLLSVGLSGIGAVGFPILPHRILSNPTIFSNASELAIATAEQQQVAHFLLTGNAAEDPNQLLPVPLRKAQIFEQFKKASDLPEALQFLQVKP